jgi:hypothetical protein
MAAMVSTCFNRRFFGHPLRLDWEDGCDSPFWTSAKDLLAGLGPRIFVFLAGDFKCVMVKNVFDIVHR